MKKLTRREFLKIASIGTASAFAMSCGLINDAQEVDMPQTQNTTYATVIVIGAGISGLAAARILADKNIDVIILEARNRIGGRMWTDSSLGIPLDLGAASIHGVKNNPITDLAKKFNIQTIPTDYDNFTTFDANGNELSEDAWDEMEELFDSVYAEVEEMQDDTDNDMSLQQAFDQVISKRKLSKEELLRLNFYIQQETSLEYGADPKDLSLWEWNQDGSLGGGEVIFPNGYNQITDVLAKSLDIRLNVIVESIHYGNGSVSVKTSSGEFVAEKVVVTIPLGVLKQAQIKFEPPLPQSKQDAMNRLDMGVLNKVYLKFPKVFWDDEVEGFGFISEKLGEWNDWLSFAPYLNEPILMAFHGGEKGFAIENFSDEEVIADAMKTLRFLFGDSIPEPESFIITRWGKDKFSFGSYSHIPPFASGDDFDALFEPVDVVLFFAGEATHRKFPATVHGAYLSGIEVGRLVIGNL
jgi:monoamine oxidase